MESYSVEDKEKLAKKIGKIKNKTHLKNILKMIKQDENIGKITKNSNGVFVMFHMVSNDTCNKINNYIIKSHRQTTSECSASSDMFYSDSCQYSETNETISGIEKINYDDVKLSNEEKNIIKRRMYDDAVNKMNDM